MDDSNYVLYNIDEDMFVTNRSGEHELTRIPIMATHYINVGEGEPLHGVLEDFIEFHGGHENFVWVPHNMDIPFDFINAHTV